MEAVSEKKRGLDRYLEDNARLLCPCILPCNEAIFGNTKKCEIMQQVLEVTNAVRLWASSERVHNNWALPVGINNICECFV